MPAELFGTVTGRPHWALAPAGGPARAPARLSGPAAGGPAERRAAAGGLPTRRRSRRRCRSRGRARAAEGARRSDRPAPVDRHRSCPLRRWPECPRRRSGAAPAPGGQQIGEQEPLRRPPHPGLAGAGPAGDARSRRAAPNELARRSAADDAAGRTWLSAARSRCCSGRRARRPGRLCSTRPASQRTSLPEGVPGAGAPAERRGAERGVCTAGRRFGGASGPPASSAPIGPPSPSAAGLRSASSGVAGSGEVRIPARLTPAGRPMALARWSLGLPVAPGPCKR
jgi:hypothetical protein